MLTYERPDLDFRKNKSMPHIRYGLRQYGKEQEAYSIFLPMPNGLTTSDALDWQEEDNWGEAASAVLGSAGDTLTKGFEAGGGGSSGALGTAKKSINAIKELATDAFSASKNLIEPASSVSEFEKPAFSNVFAPVNF